MAGSFISPVNGLRVDWSADRLGFPCNLPSISPNPRTVDIVEEEGCCTPPEFISWAPFLSEVIVGIDAPNEDIAANYIRATAIDFCNKTKCLKRIIGTEVSREICLETYKNEKVVGISDVRFRLGGRISYYNCSLKEFDRMRFDQQTQKLSLDNYFIGHQWKTIEIMVACAPTEEALYVDKYLFDAFRKEIAQQARAEYVRANHFRDRDLLATIQPAQQYAIDCAMVRNKISAVASSSTLNSGRRQTL